ITAVLQQPPEMMDVVLVTGATGLLLHFYQGFQRHETRLHIWRHVFLHRAVVFLIEYEWHIDEHVDRRFPVAVAEQTQNRHSLLLDPALARRVIGELFTGHGYRGPI